MIDMTTGADACPRCGGRLVSLRDARPWRAGHGPDRWRAEVAASRAAAAPRLPLLRQLSVRDEASLFASHSPAGLRRRMLEGRSAHEPAVVLTDDRMTRIDAELSGEYEKVRRAVSWSG